MRQGKMLSFPSVLLLGINGIIGSGVFLLPSTLYKQAGVWSLLAIVIAGLGTTIIALNYAHLAAQIDADGGAWVYAARAFGDFSGFMTGWIAWLLGVITIAAEVAAFLTTLGGLWAPAKDRGVYTILALGIIGILGVLNLFGPQLLQIADNLASGFKIGIIAVFVIGGAFAIGSRHLHLQGAGTLSGGSLLAACVTAFYMFTGFSFLPTAAHDMRNPNKVLPKALLLIMAGCTALYAAVHAVTLTLLGSGVATTKLPVARAFAEIWGETGRALVLSGMLVSILGVALAVAFAAPVGVAALANDHHLLPAPFGHVNKDGAPTVAILLTTVCAALLVVSGGYLFLVQLIVLCSFLQYIGTAMAALRLTPKTEKPLRRLGVPVISCALAVAILTQFTLRSYMITLAVGAFGCLVYYWDWRRNKRHNLNG